MNLDIAPFATVEEDGPWLAFRWEELREILRIELEYGGSRPPTGRLPIEYWLNSWPGSRPEKEDLAPGRAGRAAWKAYDDWFNGAWQAADAICSRRGSRMVLEFHPLDRTEFPELTDYGVNFRRTLKLRIRCAEGARRPKEVCILTNSGVETRKVTLQLGCGRRRSGSRASIEVYNGRLEARKEPSGGDPRFHLTLLCSRPSPFSHDATVVTVRSREVSLSFRPDEVERGRPIWVKDLAVLVTLTEDDVLYSRRYVKALGTSASIYDRIGELPEQTFQRATSDNPPKRPMHFIVGAEGRRQKFGVEPNGDIFAGIGFVRRIPGPDTGRVSWQGSRLYIRFHWDDLTPAGRFPREGYLPIIGQRFCGGGLEVEQEVLATLLSRSILAEGIRAEDSVVALALITYRNRGESPIQVCQRMSTEAGRPRAREALELDGEAAFAGREKNRARFLVDRQGRGRLGTRDGEVTYELDLAPGSSHSIMVKIPFEDILREEGMSQLSSKNWQREMDEVGRYWRNRVAQGTQLRTGVPDIDEFHSSLLTHILINDDHEVESDCIIGRVSSFNYGNFPNEAIMQILELDRRGFHELAARHLETYVRYQGTVMLPGNFQGKEGLFYGSGGYESGSYNQHHGWVLYGLAQHYRYTQDDEWLRRIAPSLVAGCDWVARERRATMVTGPDGKEVLEYGFLPAGAVEDVREYCYWLSTNCLTYRGLTAAASALEEIGHPEGARIAEEARAYGSDLLRGIRESMVRSPVVRLRDGTCVPHVPSRLYWRGRDVGWIREVLEGSVIAITTLLDADDRMSTWILKDFEGNRYLDWPLNYPLDDFEARWFSLGGFSMQPNLVYTLSPYLPRNQTKHFLRSFFNAFAACWRADIRSMTEHPLPTLADWAGDHFKSSDESMSAYALRSMFIHESGRELHLGKAIPRSWLGPGAELWIRKACTYFGPMSLEYSVSQDLKMISIIVDPPKRNPPDRVVLTVRHPREEAIKTVEVDGMRCPISGEEIDLGALQRRVQVRADY